jgi:hypothetical protein
MTTITIEVPDELAERLGSLGPLPDLLTQLLESSSGEKMSQAVKRAATHPVYRQMIDFLAAGPRPQQIIEFEISPKARDRLEELLDKNREEGLSDAESAELDVYELVHHSLIQLKAHARMAKSSGL